MKKAFNIVITGTGGQGLITLLQIIAEAALAEGFEVRTSELHGLSQRGGSVEVHIRFGKEVYSPMVAQGSANLILGLEMQEAMKGIYFASKETKFLINKHIVPIPLEKSLGKENKSSSLPFANARVSEKEILNSLNKASKNIFLVPAFQICQEKLGAGVAAGVYLISLASAKKLLPLKPASISEAIKKTIPAKYLELNLKAFKLAQG